MFLGLGLSITPIFICFLPFIAPGPQEFLFLDIRIGGICFSSRFRVVCPMREIKEDTAILHYSNTHLLAQPLPCSILGTRFVQPKMSQPRHPPHLPCYSKKTVHDNGVKGSEGVYSPHIFTNTVISHFFAMPHFLSHLLLFFLHFPVYIVYNFHTHTLTHTRITIPYGSHGIGGTGQFSRVRGRKRNNFRGRKYPRSNYISAGLGWEKMNIRSDTRRDIKRRRRERICSDRLGETCPFLLDYFSLWDWNLCLAVLGSGRFLVSLGC